MPIPDLGPVKTPTEADKRTVAREFAAVIDRSSKVTEKERRFVEGFLGAHAGNGSAAAAAAGYAYSSRSVTAARLLRKARVQKLIAAKLKKAEEKGLLTIEERLAFLSDAVRDKTLDFRQRLRALDVLQKSTGQYSVGIHTSGKLTLEDALDRATKVLEGGK